MSSNAARANDRAARAAGSPAGDEWDPSSGDLFNKDQIRNYVLFVVGSLRRRRWLAAGVFVSMVAMAVALLLIAPRTYHVEAKVLAQRNQVLAIRGDSPDMDVAPTRGAEELVRSRDSLLAVIQSTDLVRHHRENRGVVGRVMEGARRLAGREDTPEDQLDAMVELLGKRLSVWTTDGTVSIGVDWTDPHMAVLLVDTALRNFLDQRYAQEVTTLVEAIAILRGHAGSAQKAIDEAVATVEHLRDQRQPAEDGAAGKAPPPLPRFASQIRRALPSAEPDPAVAQLKKTMDATEQSIADLEEARRRGLADTQAKLVEQRTTFTENHPVVLELRRAATALSAPTPEVLALRQKLSSLEASYTAKRSEQATASQPSGFSNTATPYSTDSLATPEVPTGIQALDASLREERDPNLVYARGELREAMDKYSALRTRVQAGQMDLETAKAAFKYRYNVVTPAKLPKKPVKPKALLLLGIGIMAAALSAVVIATIADMRSGRVLESWQLEELLGAPVLGEIELRRLQLRNPG